MSIVINPQLAQAPRTSIAETRQDRIAIVCQLPFTDIDHPKMEVEAILDHGFAIDAIDVSRVLYPGRPCPAREYAPPAGVAVCEIASNRDLNGILPALEKASLVVCNVSSGHITPRNLGVMRIISKAQTPYVLISRGAIPIIDPVVGRRTFSQRVRQIDIANSVLNRIPLNLLGVRPADYVVWGGDASRIPLRLVSERTRQIWSFSENYQTYQAEMAAQPIVPEKNTAVYLDQYFGFHPDTAVRGKRFSLTPDLIYPRLRWLFDRIETQLGLEVVIAAHPRADYSDKPGIYGERRIVTGKTVELVRESRLVICAYSTAASFAVLFEKPLMVVSAPEISNIRALPAAPEALARSVGTVVLDLSQPDSIDLSKAMNWDSRQYKRYVERYIVSAKSERKGIADIFADLCDKRSSVSVGG